MSHSARHDHLNDPAVAQLHDPFPVGGVFLGVRDLYDGHSLFI